VTQALIVDYGGVLTSKLGDTLDEWCRADGLDRELVDAVVAGMYREPDSIVHALEMGRISPDEFSLQFVERVVAAGGTAFDPVGMLGRMFGGFAEDVSMTGAVLATRQAGFKTALLSNSWGNDYPRDAWDALFDVTVISGEVGMRKPDPRIFLHTAELLGVPPGECVFVDDLAHNIRGAVGVGMVGVHHTSTSSTLQELEVLFGVSFGS
jgi:epoxide hydrolase-like predicted phosphatase